MEEFKTTDHLTTEEHAAKNTAVAEAFAKKDRKRKRENWITLLVLFMVLAAAVTWFHRTYTKEMAALRVSYQQSLQNDYTEEDLVAIAFLQELQDRVDIITGEYDGLYSAGPEEETFFLVNRLGHFVFFEAEIEGSAGVKFSSLSARGRFETVTMAKEMYERLSAVGYVEGDPSFGEDQGEAYSFFKYIDRLMLDRGISTLDKALEKLYMGDNTTAMGNKLYYIEKVRVIQRDEWVWAQIDKVTAMITQ